MSFVSTVSTYIALNALEILMLSVDSVNIYSIYSNAIVYCVWYLVCRYCWYEDQSTQCIECYVYRDCQYTGVCGSYTTPYTEYYEVWKHQCQQSWHSIAFNALHALIFLSTVSTNKIPYSIHNSVPLILWTNYPDMPFIAMYIQTTM